MAKQTFTTGQVLTAAQMTSLQQTAMGGGSTTAKTASYVLVAADAGTVVQMNSASATTITVNTALFAAGDTVEIQNVGAGVCTVTAGTATVNTSSTLALKQYDAGSLYFNSTSAAIFFATDAADSTSPLTTKGDLYGFSTLDARIPIGTNNQVLTADSAQALGLKWATASSGALVFIKRVSFSAVATTTTSFDSIFTSTYKNYVVVIEKIISSTNAQRLLLQVRQGGVTNSGANYFGTCFGYTSGGTLWTSLSASATALNLFRMSSTAAVISGATFSFGGVGNAVEFPEIYATGVSPVEDGHTLFAGRLDNPSTIIDGIIFSVAAGTITGVVSVYGLATS